MTSTHNAHHYGESLDKKRAPQVCAPNCARRFCARPKPTG